MSEHGRVLAEVLRQAALRGDGIEPSFALGGEIDSAGNTWPEDFDAGHPFLHSCLCEFDVSKALVICRS